MPCVSKLGRHSEKNVSGLSAWVRPKTTTNPHVMQIRQKILSMGLIEELNPAATPSRRCWSFVCSCGPPQFASVPGPCRVAWCAHTAARGCSVPKVPLDRASRLSPTPAARARNLSDAGKSNRAQCVDVRTMEVAAPLFETVQSRAHRHPAPGRRGRGSKGLQVSRHLKSLTT